MKHQREFVLGQARQALLELGMITTGLKGIGRSMAIHGDFEGTRMTEAHTAQLGYLIEAAGSYAERLSCEIEAALGGEGGK